MRSVLFSFSIRSHAMAAVALGVLCAAGCQTPTASTIPGIIGSKVPASSMLVSEGSQQLFFMAPSSGVLYLVDPAGGLVATFPTQGNERIAANFAGDTLIVTNNDKELFRREQRISGRYALYFQR